jgi:RNA polymerase sigma factor (sigma-70 family)
VTTIAPEHLRLVENLAKSFAGKHCNTEWQDYVTSGYLGLQSAMKSWNPAKGASFFTHASMRIYGSMIDQYRVEFGKKDSHKARAAGRKQAIDDVDFVSAKPLRPRLDEWDDIERLCRYLPERRQRMIARMAADGIQQGDIARAVGVSDSRISQILQREIRPVMLQLMQKRMAA